MSARRFDAPGAVQHSGERCRPLQSGLSPQARARKCGHGRRPGAVCRVTREHKSRCRRTRSCNARCRLGGGPSLVPRLPLPAPLRSPAPLYVQASLNVSAVGQDMDEEAALRWAQEESLKASKDAALPDLMLESELQRATQLSLRQSQLEAERLRQQEAANDAELAKGVQASLEAAPRPPPAKPARQQERGNTAPGEPEYSSNYDPR